MTPAEDFFKVNPPSRLDFRSPRPPLPREFPESHPSGGCGFFLEQPNFSSSVEKYFTNKRSERVKYFFNTRREISCLQAALLCSIYYLNTNELPNHFTLIVFWCERRDLLCSHSNGDIFTSEDNMFFSHVKISSFRTKAHLVFHWC